MSTNPNRTHAGQIKAVRAGIKHRQEQIDRYIDAIDRLMRARAGVSVHDLPDQPFAAWWEDGIDPDDAVDLILETEGHVVEAVQAER
jgi:hypothetical protein